ncbi:hypothetical protein NDU88_003132 [Pleurodeles waltl]|uniref:Uncharacterized protein n=1 Tax=Pleurodeles waltl TaxID=8319 RepID=A0AAV7TMK4_PLEWA|nr:hypothetical protein NDU88_003132 [Pleurodeles waltl]
MSVPGPDWADAAQMKILVTQPGLLLGCQHQPYDEKSAPSSAAGRCCNQQGLKENRVWAAWLHTRITREIGSFPPQTGQAVAALSLAACETTRNGGKGRKEARVQAACTAPKAMPGTGSTGSKKRATSSSDARLTRPTPQIQVVSTGADVTGALTAAASIKAEAFLGRHLNSPLIRCTPAAGPGSDAAPRDP